MYVNPAFCKITGYRADEVIGKTPKLLQGAKTNPETIKRLKTQLKQGLPFHGSTVNYKNDGTEYHVEWKINPVFDENGQLIYFLSVQRDLTYIKSFLNRMLSTTRTFRTLLNEFFHNSPDKASAAKSIKQATREEIKNMSLFSEALSRPKEDTFDNELVLNEQQMFGVMPVHQSKQAMSAAEYSTRQTPDAGSIRQLTGLIDDCLVNLEFAKIKPDDPTYLNQVLNDFQDFANIVFFMDEFIEISTVLGQLVSSLTQQDDMILDNIFIDILTGLADDLKSWVDTIFIAQTAHDIHELDDSIIGSARQIIFMMD